jgi:hypothetical protein
MPTGRVQIARPDAQGAPFPIRSQEWGNVLWDQSVNCFADPTDRNAQWPAPHEGALCYLESTARLYVFTSGTWRYVQVEAQPRGIIASGPQVSAPAASSVVTTNNVIGGASSWLTTGTSVITIPPGAGGLYQVQLVVRYMSPTVQAVSFAVEIGPGADRATMVLGGLVPSGNPITYLHGSWLRQCNDADNFRVWYVGNAMTGGHATVQRFSFMRVGDQLAST